MRTLTGKPLRRPRASTSRLFSTDARTSAFDHAAATMFATRGYRSQSSRGRSSGGNSRNQSIVIPVSARSCGCGRRRRCSQWSGERVATSATPDGGSSSARRASAKSVISKLIASAGAGGSDEEWCATGVLQHSMRPVVSGAHGAVHGHRVTRHRYSVSVQRVTQDVRCDETLGSDPAPKVRVVTCLDCSHAAAKKAEHRALSVHGLPVPFYPSCHEHLVNTQLLSEYFDARVSDNLHFGWWRLTGCSRVAARVPRRTPPLKPAANRLSRPRNRSRFAVLTTRFPASDGFDREPCRRRIGHMARSHAFDYYADISDDRPSGYSSTGFGQSTTATPWTASEVSTFDVPSRTIGKPQARRMRERLKSRLATLALYVVALIACVGALLTRR